MTQEALSPTPERFKKSKWDEPELSRTTERRAYKARDIWDELLRKGDIEEPEHQSAGRFQHHYEGYLGYDVRIVDQTASKIDDSRKSGWERHASEIEAARAELVPSEFRALGMLANGCTMIELGRELQGYRAEAQARAYALRTVQTALERLAYMWEYRIKKPPSIR